MLFRLFYLWWVLALPACITVITVYVLNSEAKTVRVEVRATAYQRHVPPCNHQLLLATNCY